MNEKIIYEETLINLSKFFSRIFLDEAFIEIFKIFLKNYLENCSSKTRGVSPIPLWVRVGRGDMGVSPSPCVSRETSLTFFKNIINFISHIIFFLFNAFIFHDDISYCFLNYMALQRK